MGGSMSRLARPMLVCCGACHRLYLNRYIGRNLANLNVRGSPRQRNFSDRCGNGKPAAAYRTTIRNAGDSDVLVKDMQQSEGNGLHMLWKAILHCRKQCPIHAAAN
jgi:hypothetical protein